VVTKAEHKVEEAKRVAAVLSLATDAAMDDAATAITTNVSDWLAALDTEQAASRDRGLDALDRLQDALHDLRGAASAGNWLRGATADGRFDRPQQVPVLGAAAPSSARVSANGQPFDSTEVIGWARELLVPPVSGRGVGPLLDTATDAA
jgi:hypothetical protein